METPLAVSIFVGTISLINLLLLLVLNQLWVEIRRLRDWRHTAGNTLTEIAGRLKLVEEDLREMRERPA